MASTTIGWEDLSVAFLAVTGGTASIGHTGSSLAAAQLTQAATYGVSILQAGNTAGQRSMAGDKDAHIRGRLSTVWRLAGIAGDAQFALGQITQLVAVLAAALVERVGRAPRLQIAAVLATGTAHQLDAALPVVLGKAEVLLIVGTTALAAAGAAVGAGADVAAETIRRIGEGIAIAIRAGGTARAALIAAAGTLIVQLLVVQATAQQLLVVQQRHQTLALALPGAQLRALWICDTLLIRLRVAVDTAGVVRQLPGIVAFVRLADEAQLRMLATIAILIVIHIVGTATSTHSLSIQIEYGLTVLLRVEGALRRGTQGGEAMLTLAGVTLQWQRLEQTMLTIIHTIGQINRIALAAIAAAAVAVIVAIAGHAAAAAAGGHIVGQRGLTGFLIVDPETGRGSAGIGFTSAVVRGATAVAEQTIGREDLQGEEQVRLARKGLANPWMLTPRLQPSSRQSSQLVSLPSRQAAKSAWGRSYRQPRVVAPSVEAGGD